MQIFHNMNSQIMNKKIVITGASGMLGRRLTSYFNDSSWEVLGLAYSRAKNNLLCVDLGNNAELTKVINEFQMFLVVHFLQTEEVEVVPKSWFLDGFCFWPPYKSGKKIHEAVKNCEKVNNTWDKHSARIIDTYDSYASARQKLKKAEDYSDLNSNSEDYGRGKRKKPRKEFISSDSDCYSEIDENDKPTYSKQKAIPSPPQFPSNIACNAEEFSSGLCSRGTNKTGRKSSSPTTNLSRGVLSVIQPNQVSTEQYASSGFSDINCSSKSASRIQNSRSSEGKGHKSQTSSEISSFGSDVQQRILRSLQQMKLMLQQHSEMLHFIMENKCSQQISILNETDRPTDDNSSIPVELPIMTDWDLNVLEAEVKNNNSLKNTLVSILSATGGRTVQEVTKRILTKLLTYEVGQEYSWVGAKGKKSFSTLLIADIITLSVRNVSATKHATEKDVEEIIKSWLRHCKERSSKRKQ